MTPPNQSPLFTTTHWSVVLAAAGAANERADQALDQLCRSYWYPLYAYVRSRGYSAHDAQDLIQGFFEQLLRRESIRHRTPEQGRFRFFLLTSLNYYMSDSRDRAHAFKRGSGQRHIALDALEPEERFRFEPVDRLSPDKIFERRWALTTINMVLERLEAECREAGQSEQFNALRSHLFGADAEAGYGELAQTLGTTPGALRVVAHRLRQRSRQLLREMLAHTVENSAEVEDELRFLRSALAS